MSAELAVSSDDKINTAVSHRPAVSGKGVEIMFKKLHAVACAAVVGLGMLSAVPVGAVNDYAKKVNTNDLKSISGFILGAQNYTDNQLDVNDDTFINTADSSIIKRILTGEYKFPEAPVEFDDITASELTQKIVLGWNLGNTLDSTTTSWLADPSPTQSETAWGNPVTTKEMIDGIKAGGFNLVRIPTSWIDHTGAGPDYKIDDDWLARVREVVDYVIENDMYCILNIHHENDWLIPRASAKSSVEQRLAAIWKQIGEVFKDYDERLILEGMNEPRLVGDPTEWNGGTSEARQVINSYNQTFVDTVRATGSNNAKRILMVPTYAASCMDSTVNEFVLPKDTVTNKLIVSIHSYSPYYFALAPDGTSTFSQSDEAGLKDTIKYVYDSFVAKGTPVIIGEFGAQNRDNTSDRVRWAEMYVSIAKSYGIKCVWWDNNLFSGTGEKFGLFNRATLQYDPPELLEALLKGANS